MIYKGKYIGLLITLTFVLIFTGLFIIKPSELHASHFISFSLLLITSLFLGNLYDKNVIRNSEFEDKEKYLNNIFDSLDIFAWTLDPNTSTLRATSGVRRIYGIPASEFTQKSELWKEVTHPEDIEQVKEMDYAMRIGKNSVVEYRILRPDGCVRWVQDRCIPVFNDKDDYIRADGLVIDITERKALEQKSKESEELYRTIVEISPEPIFIHKEAKIIYVNQSAINVFEANSSTELIGTTLYEFFDLDHDNQSMLNTRLKAIMTEGRAMSRETTIQSLLGNTIAVEATSIRIEYYNEPAIMTLFHDITERKNTEKQLNYMAYYDRLTNLPNRRLLTDRQQSLLSNAIQKTKKIAVLFIDLDRFKTINDTLGHSIGDELLIEVAARLVQCVNEEDTVYRISGDEFIIVLEEIEAENDVHLVATNIINHFNKPFELDSKEVYTTPSIGISIYPDHGDDFESIIKNADIAMYLAKEMGKNNYRFYSANLALKAEQKFMIEQGLRRALINEEFYVEYQPKLNLTSNEVIGLEALIRWNRPDKGMVFPGDFIPIAEETGLILPIGEWILRKACQQNKKWQEDGFTPFRVAVNVSSLQLQTGNFAETVTNILEETNLAPQYFEIELTESIFQNEVDAKTELNKLRDLGVVISIDDFGTGYSSLSYLKNLPIDILKIDQSFVKELDIPIIKSIVYMAHHLKIDVIAEGIETKEQLSFLKSVNCNNGQGYLFSPPISAKDMEERFLQRSNSK